MNYRTEKVHVTQNIIFQGQEKMIEKYYDGAIEQVAAGLGTVEKNHLLVRYSGQFSVENLNDTKQLEKNEDIFRTGT